MAAVQVSHQFMDQITLVGDALHPAIPEVMVRVTERNFRLNRVFLCQGQPVIISERHTYTSYAGQAQPMIPLPNRPISPPLYPLNPLQSKAYPQ